MSGSDRYPNHRKDIAERLGMDGRMRFGNCQLEEMAKKGLLFRVRKGENVRYAAVPYVVGIFEYQLNHMDTEFARDHEEYFARPPLERTIQGFSDTGTAHCPHRPPAGGELSGGALSRMFIEIHRKPEIHCGLTLRMPDHKGSYG